MSQNKSTKMKYERKQKYKDLKIDFALNLSIAIVLNDEHLCGGTLQSWGFLDI